MRTQAEADWEATEERIFAPPLWFDVSIGYWTGEPDLEALRRAARSLLTALSASWQPWPQSAICNPQSAGRIAWDADRAVAYLCETPGDATVAADEAAVRLRRCPRQHLHVVVAVGDSWDAVERIMLRAGLSRMDTCLG